MLNKIPAVGTKAQVFHSAARHTSGGLKKKDLMKTKQGRIVSRKKHAAGKKAIKRLFALGYKPKKGTFKAMRKSMVNGRKKGTRKRGGYWGNAVGAPTSPAASTAATKVPTATGAATVAPASGAAAAAKPVSGSGVAPK